MIRQFSFTKRVVDMTCNNLEDPRVQFTTDTTGEINPARLPRNIGARSGILDPDTAHVLISDSASRVGEFPLNRFGFRL